LPFDGYGIGGSLGNGREELKELLEWMMPLFDIGERKNDSVQEEPDASLLV
jgi:queuine tRNA-ribosyltransferase